MYKTIDLCAGIGGIRRGFERTGHFTNVLSAEIDESAARTYQHLFGDDPRADLTSSEFKNIVSETEYDVLLAGFPCQPFSSQGNKEGFNDPTKGTVFFHIEEIIRRTRPKVVLLENVRNIVSHDDGKTIRIILEKLIYSLHYKVVGVTTEGSHLVYDADSFVRNTKDFGLPQNRPRAFFVAFDARLYGALVGEPEFDALPRKLNTRMNANPLLNHQLVELIEPVVDLHYYMSRKYLKTLEEHAAREKAKGNGYSYCILNEGNRFREYSNTLLATGGSGKERNLLVQPMPPHTIEDEKRLRKKDGLNDKNVRMMTPTEWGRLQGFIGYGFVDSETGREGFSFPEGTTEYQKYKQFGNSVSIPVIETLADYIYERLEFLRQHEEEILLRLIHLSDGISKQDVMRNLCVSKNHAQRLLKKLMDEGKICLKNRGRYSRYVLARELTHVMVIDREKGRVCYIPTVGKAQNKKDTVKEKRRLS
jgi:DNA (cytosine-5)-methyltransferase 1